MKNLSLGKLFQGKGKHLVLLIALGIAFLLLRDLMRHDEIVHGDWQRFWIDLFRNCYYACLILIFSLLLGLWRPLRSISLSLAIAILLLLAIDSAYMLIHFKHLFKSSAEVETKMKTESQISESFHASFEPHGLYIEDQNYGFRNWRNDTIKSVVNVNGQQLEPVYYIMDAFGRRINRNTADSGKSKYALFFGGSLTLGQHVAENESYPARFESSSSEYRSYNYGISASGTNHMLAKFQEGNLRDEIKESDGICIYGFFEHHVNRSISDYVTFQWNHATPYFYVEEDDVVRDGSFDTGRPILSAMYNILSKSYFVNSIQFNHPKFISDEHYRLCAKLIDASRRSYINQFGNEDFFVFVLPGFDSKMIPYLEELEIQYIDGRSWIKGDWDDYIFPIDNHPKPMVYEILADSLHMELKKRNVY